MAAGDHPSKTVQRNSNLETIVEVRTMNATLPGGDSSNSTQGVTFKPVVSSNYSGTQFGDDGTANLDVSSTATQLFSVWATNKGSQKLYIHIFNDANSATNGDTPLFRFPLPPGTDEVPGFAQADLMDFGLGGFHLSAGLTVGISSTYDTFTAHTTPADLEIGGIRL